MKGIVYTDFGHPHDVLKLMEVKKPIPTDEQVLIKVVSSSLSQYDYQRFIDPVNGKGVSATTRYMDGEFAHIVGNVIGMDIAGIVEEVGKNVTNVKKGDEVYAVSANLIGGWAEFAVANADEVCVKPSNLTFDEAASVTSTAITALGTLRTANLQKGQHILIIGATGGVGQFAVQLAKELGLIVTAVCSTKNIEMVQQLGADYIIDYTKEDLTNSTQKYDAILGISGHQTLQEYKNLLNPNGVYIPVSTELLLEAQQQGEAVFNDDKKVIPFYYLMMKDKEMPYLKELFENNKLSIVMDKSFSIRNIADAIVEVIKKHPQGKISIKMDF